MFSEALYIMDRNTEKMMYEELEEEIKQLQLENASIKHENASIAIKSTIETGKAFGISRQDILAKLIDMYNLPESEAKTLLDQYMPN